MNLHVTYTKHPLLKNIIGFLFFTFCMFFFYSASAQRFIGGVAAGLNISQVDGDEVFGYSKVGFNGGPFVKLMLDRKQRFSLTMELLYTQKGAVKRVPGTYVGLVAFGDTLFIDHNYPEVNRKIFYLLRTDYLELPLVVHYEDPRSKICVGVGFSWARLAYIKEYEWDFSTLKTDTGARRLTTTVSSGRYYKTDWGIMADVKIPIYKKLKLNFRYQYSLAPFGTVRHFYSHNFLSPDPNAYKSVNRWPYHNTLTIRIVYSINEKYVENTNYDRDGNRIGPAWVRDPDAMKW